ncbi:MAG: ABC transporter ATP-binding protein, partial [Deltaproteobacteria bacterium]|nr:ABC transporter ATP-binding protein [Deltaproteobacteria bacterium]
AVNDLSFEIKEREIVGLIGPNGAGKTTVFNLISGIFFPSQGRIYMAGKEITQVKPHLRSLMGIGRTFQIVRPFDGMTILENVMVPILARDRDPHKAEKSALEVLQKTGILHLAQASPQNITFAQRKRLEIARALATKPRLLLLDEVLAGLNPVEVEESLPLIRQIRESGVTVFMIEHVMAALMSVSGRVLVMDEGKLIAAGTPAEVTANRRVIEAYLGEEEEASAAG